MNTKKPLSILLTLALVLGLLPWSVMPARAEASGVDYVGEDGRRYNTATDDIEGNDAPTPIPLDKTGLLPAGWYVVDKTLEYNDESAPDKRLKFKGTDVHIILADGCTLTAPGIHCLGSLTIYGQAGGTGKIVSSCPDNHGVNANGSLTIHGGAITATNSKDAKGICCVSFLMTGGQVTVQGDTGGISGTGTAEIGFRTAKDSLSLETQGAVFSDFASVTIAKGQVMTDGTNFYTDTERLEQITALKGKTLRLDESQCEARIGDTKYAAVQTALNAAAADQTVTLLRDVTTDATLTVPAGADVTLDLNGHTVDRGLAGKDSADNGSVITVNGTLTLTDSSQDKTGTITGGNTAQYGGGVYVGTNGAFTMEGGTITGNTAQYGGGVYVYNGTFTMSGGTVSGNNASSVGSGGGVFVYGDSSGDATFTMSGGEVSANTAAYGGGVYVYAYDYGSATLFTMSGGTVSNNTATSNGGGVCVDGYAGGKAAFTLSDGEISKNTASNGGGVCVCGGDSGSAKFTMTGGTVSGNTATDGGGVYVYNGGSNGNATFTMSDGAVSGCTATQGGGVYVEGAFNLSGTPAVSGNTGTDGKTASNVYLSGDKSITVTGALTDSAELWVSAESGAVVARGGSAYVLTDADAACFRGDSGNGSLVGVLDKDNGAAVVRLLTPWAALQARFDNASTNADAPTKITLAANVTAGEGDTALMIPSGKTVTLDLNGHTIDRGLADVNNMNDLNGNDGYVLRVDGGLTLTDRSEARTGAITGGNNGTTFVDAAPGGVLVAGGGTLTMNGGAISGNKTHYKDGGGVYVADGGTLTMNGGTISGNNATNFGGGVCVADGGAFELHGGTISGNSAGSGGGVMVYGTAGAFTMDDGTISGNTADRGGGVYVEGAFGMSGGSVTGNNCADDDYYQGGGVYVAQGGGFAVSGGASVTDNFRGGTRAEDGKYAAGGSGTANNVYLSGDKSITVADALTKNAGIGVTSGGLSVFTSGWSTYMSEADPAGCFTSDDACYVVMRNDDGEAELRFLNTVTVENGTADKTTAVEGETVTVTANAPAAGKVFDRWTADDDVEFADAGKAQTTFTMPWWDVTVTATYHDYSLANGKVYAPKGAVLICAAYSGGRMTGMQSVTINADCADKAPSSLGLTVPASGYQLMLVDGATYAPLCAAWEG